MLRCCSFGYIVLFVLLLGLLGFMLLTCEYKESCAPFFEVVCGRLVIVCLCWASGFAPPPPAPRGRAGRRHLAQAQMICCSVFGYCLSALVYLIAFLFWSVYRPRCFFPHAIPTDRVFIGVFIIARDIDNNEDINVQTHTPRTFRWWLGAQGQ